MAPGRKKMAATAGPPRNWKTGDLVLAKVRGFPPWPAKVAVPEELDMSPQPSKVFVQFFGSEECAYVRHAEVSEFTHEIRATMEEKVRTGALQKQFTNAVREICVAIDEVMAQSKPAVENRPNELERLTGTQSDSPGIAEVGETQISTEKAEDAATRVPQVASDVVVPQGLSEGCTPQGPSDVTVSPAVEAEAPSYVSVQEDLVVGVAAVSADADADISAPTDMEVDAPEGSRGNDGQGIETVEGRTEHVVKEESRPENVKEVPENVEEVEGRAENLEEVEGRDRTQDLEDVEGRAENVEEVEARRTENVAKLESETVQKVEGEAGNVKKVEGQAENGEKARNEEGGQKVLKTFERRKKRVVRPAEEPKEAAQKKDKPEKKEAPDKEGGASKALKSNGVPKSEKKGAGKADVKSEKKRPRPDEAEGKQEKKKKKLKLSSPDGKEETVKRKNDGAEKTFVKRKDKHRVRSDSEASPPPKRLKSAKAESSKPGKAETSKLAKSETPKVAKGETKGEGRKVTKAETKGEGTKAETKAEGAKAETKGEGTKAETKAEGTKAEGAKAAKAEAAKVAKADAAKVAKAEASKVAKAETPVETAKVEAGKADTGKTKLKVETKQELKVTVSAKKPASAVKPSDLTPLSTPASSKYASEVPNKVREAVEAAKEMKQRIAQKEEASSATMKYLKAKTTKAHNTESPMFLLPSPDAVSSPERHHKLEKHGSIGSKARSTSSSRDVERGVALDTFQGMLESLTRAKDSILKATRYAMECANKGLAKQVMDVIMKKLKNEKDNRKRVDLLFLVDSMTQYNHHKGGRDQANAKAGYAPIVEACLARFISAVAPPNSSNENHRQCMKVVNLWMSRKIMDLSVLKSTMSSLHIAAGLNTTQRQYQKENQTRAVDDPLRGMDDMVVDEYGSNTGFQMPGLLARPVDEEEEEEEAVGLTAQATEDQSMKHRVVLEDLEGELEMEDVSPTSNGYTMSKASPLSPTRQEQDTTVAPSSPPPPPLPASPPPAPPPPPGV